MSFSYESIKSKNSNQRFDPVSLLLKSQEKLTFNQGTLRVAKNEYPECCWSLLSRYPEQENMLSLAWNQNKINNISLLCRFIDWSD